MMKTDLQRRAPARVMALGAVVLLAAACGQKGDLYLPEQERDRVPALISGAEAAASALAPAETPSQAAPATPAAPADEEESSRGTGR